MNKNLYAYVKIIIIIQIILLPVLKAQESKLANMTITGKENISAESVIAGPDLVISETGDLTIKTNSLIVKPKIVILNGGQLSVITGEVDPVSVENTETIIPEEFVVYQNYPNPFNPVTTIKYSLPVADFVNISVYNLLGQKVAVLMNKNQASGTYRLKWDATGFVSGVYVYKFSARSGFLKTKKLVLLK
jgi:hypothetical protein